MGIFEIKLEGFKETNVIVMRNAINQLNPKNTIRYRFDLKGSKLNRSELPKSLSKTKLRSLAEQCVLKDNDLIEIMSMFPDLINLKL